MRRLERVQRLFPRKPQTETMTPKFIKKEDPKTTTEVSKVHKGRTEDKIIKDRTDLDVLVSPAEEFKAPA